MTVLDTITRLILPDRESTEALRVVKYAPRFRLAFSLLNEDASSGTGVTSWDIREAINRTDFLVSWLAGPDRDLGYLSPTLDKLSILHNFTIESQVQYHAPLAFHLKDLQVGETIAHGVTPEDLTVFVNSAEWTLCTSIVSYYEWATDGYMG